jgi:two-component system chemotaxis response regulator CheY
MKNRVVICDDAGFIREILTNELTRLGYQVVGEATTGPESVRMIAELVPDYVFLDMVLPEMNGCEVATEVLAIHQESLLIGMSTVEFETIREKAMKAGCRDWLSKPFNKVTIKELMSRLEQQRQKKEVAHG